MTIIVPPISRDGFSLDVADVNDELHVRVVGNADMEVLPAMTPFLRQLHDELGRAGIREIKVDLRELLFMNSSCLKSFVLWISSVSKLPPDSAYRIRFLSNSRLHWQRRSLEALRAFAPQVVEIVAD
jgi:hypothetical protein